MRTIKFSVIKVIIFMACMMIFSCSQEQENNDILEPQVSGLSVKEITANSAIVSADISTNIDVSAKFMFKKSSDSYWTGTETTIKVKPGKTNISNELTNLEDGNTYNVCIVVNGKISASTATFTTKTLIKAKVILNQITNVNLTTATISAIVIPNWDNTVISFEYRKDNYGQWTKTTLPTKFSGKDSLKVTLDLSNLAINSWYGFRVTASNEGGSVTSNIASFQTCAVSDYDGNGYHLVTIGTQTWLQENFRGTHFLNGDPIPNVTDQTAWVALTTPGYCYYDNNPKNGPIYGALYNWYAASDPRGLIKGMHIPSIDECYTLANYLGGVEMAGGALKEAGYSHWDMPNIGATNSSGFTALPSGARNDREVPFSALGGGFVFWSSDTFEGTVNGFYHFSPGCDESNSLFQLNGGDFPYDGLSIRLLNN